MRVSLSVSSSIELTLVVKPSLISTVCSLALRSDQEFAYWFFNNKLETLDQLKDIIQYDITGVQHTELGRRVARGIEGTFAELVRHRFQAALEDYLSKDLFRQGTQMLQTVTASPYLPPSSRDKIQVHGLSPKDGCPPLNTPTFRLDLSILNLTRPSTSMSTRASWL